jgi:hypothetical protein
MVTSLAVLDEDGAPTRAPRALFAAAAVRVGLIRAGDSLDQNLVNFALEVVTLAARVADGYPNPACEDDTVGDAIRAHLYE